MERPLAGQHFIKNAAKAEDVRPYINPFAFGLLRRHIGHGAQNRSRHRQTGGGICYRRIRIADDTFLRQLGESEVEQLGLPILRDHDVGGLQIPMHDPRRVSAYQCVGDLNSILQNFAQAEPGARNQFFQRLAFHQFHGDIV